MSPLQNLRKLFRRTYRFLFFRVHWEILVQKGVIGKQDFSKFKLLTPPRDCFWADPFVVKRDDKVYIFIEVAEYKKFKGYISVLELDLKLNLLEVRKVLEEPWHLSYPFVFEHAGTFWMIPESKANKKVTLYKCTSFPDKWQKYRDLLENQRIVDSSVFFFNNKWWLFCGGPGANHPNSNELFFIFFSDDPIDGAWTPHPLNPVKCDISGGRPAGNIFLRNGQLMRLAQNCSIGYGGSTVIYRINELTTTSYSETKIEDVHPEGFPNAIGMHHFSESEGFVASDISFYIPKFRPEIQRTNI